MLYYEKSKQKARNDYLEEILNKCREKYNNNFTYETSNYISAQDKDSYITITCLKHNVTFKSKPRNHIRHPGCYKCFREAMHNGLETFIKAAKKVHGDRYDYSKVVYIRANIPVIIICKKHGEFKQNPANHIRSQNCIKCFNESRAIRNIGTDELQASPELIDKYYSKLKSKYPNYEFREIKHYDRKCKVICKVHGELSVTPHAMLRPTGVACKYCSRRSDKKKEEFIRKAKQKHGDKFDYSKLDMNDVMCTFICKKHGEFKQERRNHLTYDHCCPGCIAEYTSLTKSEFLQKAKDKFGNLYDYSKMNYVNATTKIDIVCPLHGKFSKFPSEHIRKPRYDRREDVFYGGCPVCNTASKFEKYVFSLLQENKIKFVYQYRLKDYNFSWDFYIPDVKLAIEIDDNSHNQLEVQTNDLIKDNIMHSLDVKVARINVKTSAEKLYLIRNVKKVLVANIRFRDGDRLFSTYLDFVKYNPTFDIKTENNKYKFKLQ